MSRADGAELIAAERRRQVTEEGYVSGHDARHTAGQLAWAAACYAAPERIYRVEVNSGDHFHNNEIAWWEPWPKSWRRPEADRIRELVKAGALIAAEIDRLQAAEES